MEKSVAKCEFCNKEFSKVAYRNRHVKNVHKKTSDDKPKVQYTCELCDKEYKQKCSLQRHINTMHLPESQKYYSCKTCSYKTVHKFHLKRHSKKAHQKSKDYFKPHKCTLCGAQYKLLRRLHYHERKVHNIGGPPMIIINRKCPICSFNATGIKADEIINKHFQLVHYIDVGLHTEKLNFSSIESFFDWKKETEMKTVSFFIKKYSSPKTISYHCHRRGVYKTKGSNKRHLKKIGSCKIGAFCPAMIKVKIMTDNSVKVHYISKHIGHKLELKHIHLTKEERDRIAIQLASKVPHDEIQKGVRGTLSNNCLKRIHLMNIKDITNIEKSSLQNQKMNLVEEFKSILDNSVDTEEEFKFVKNYLKQLIPSLKAMKSASGIHLQIRNENPDFPANSNI